MAAILCAFYLVRTASDRAWVAGGLLALGAMTGYTLTRTVGMPDASGSFRRWPACARATLELWARRP